MGGDNDLIGFSNLYYLVSKESKSISVTVVKKTGTELSFGIRSLDKSAKAPGDFKALDRVITMASKEVEKVIQVEIIPKKQLPQDKEFILELYDPMVEGNPKFLGDDTQATVTITDQ